MGRVCRFYFLGASVISVKWEARLASDSEDGGENIRGLRRMGKVIMCCNSGGKILEQNPAGEVVESVNVIN